MEKVKVSERLKVILNHRGIKMSRKEGESASAVHCWRQMIAALRQEVREVSEVTDTCQNRFATLPVTAPGTQLIHYSASAVINRKPMSLPADASRPLIGCRCCQLLADTVRLQKQRLTLG
jgi:hypothetical protein